MRRIAFFDTLRGFSLVSMMLFHASYDFALLTGQTAAFFDSFAIMWWQRSIAWLFLGLAGIMCSYSHNNAKRAIRYGLVALLIWLVTSSLSLDVTINFGIMFCMAASTALVSCMQRLGWKGNSISVALVCLVLFVLTLHVSEGSIGIQGLWELRLPSKLYASSNFAWLGFPGPYFSSADYYPLLPYTLLYLAFANVAKPLKHSRWIDAIGQLSCPALTWLGKHALLVYVLHQPLICALVFCMVQALRAGGHLL